MGRFRCAAGAGLLVEPRGSSADAARDDQCLPAFGSTSHVRHRWFVGCGSRGKSLPLCSVTTSMDWAPKTKDPHKSMALVTAIAAAHSSPSSDDEQMMQPMPVGTKIGRVATIAAFKDGSNLTSHATHTHTHARAPHAHTQATRFCTMSGTVKR